GAERLKEPNHPAQKPVKVLKKIIEIASNPNQVVFDPFMGVGSTGVAALQMNRKFIGFELEKTYFEAAKKRIENAILQVSLFA
ncbi:MAG: site-specific DNA-methyltransferase, partial [Raineya sp.]|nr:site-specific DNA-methyltransferase [Raineya sp.]